jgi:hypothetical protein
VDSHPTPWGRYGGEMIYLVLGVVVVMVVGLVCVVGHMMGPPSPPFPAPLPRPQCAPAPPAPPPVVTRHDVVVKVRWEIGG